MTQDNNRDPWNLLLLGGSVAALIVSCVGLAGSFILGMVGFFIGRDQVGDNAAWILSGTFVGLALITAPASRVALQAMRGDYPTIAPPSNRVIQAAMILFGIILVIGSLAFEVDILPSLLGPPAHVLAAVLPVVVLVFMVLRRAPVLSQRRGWAHFLSGLWISPLTALVVEILAAIPIIILLILALNATLGQDFLINLLDNPDVVPDEEALNSIMSILDQPIFIVLILGYLGLLVPIIEELIKAVGLLPLLKRDISDPEGFLGGLLAGAGYGIFEALFLGQPGPGWAALMLARAGATMMHMLTAGFTGLGFARSKNTGSLRPLLKFYAIAVGLHAFWNFAAVIMGVGLAAEFMQSVEISQTLITALTIGGGAILVLLSLSAFIGIRHFSKDDKQIESSAQRSEPLLPTELEV